MKVKEMEVKEVYEEKMEAQLRELDAEIKKLDAQADQLKADTKIEFHKRRETLQAKRQAAAKKLRELKAAGDDAWKDIMAGMENAWLELKEALTHARSRFQS